MQSECRDRYLWVHIGFTGSALQFEAVGEWLQRWHFFNVVYSSALAVTIALVTS